MFTLEELRKLDTKKLEAEIESVKKDLFKARFELKAGQSKANHLVGKNKKYLAQLKTILSVTKQQQ